MMGTVRAYAQSVRSIYAGVPLWIFGMACVRAWVATLAPLMPMEPVAGGFFSVKITFDIVGMLSAAVLAFLAPRIAPLYAHTGLRRLFAVLLLLATASLACARECGMPGFYYAYAVLGGAGFVCHSLCWPEFYATFNPLRMVVYWLTARGAGEFIIWALQGYGAPHLYVMSGFMALLGSWSLGRCSHYAESHELHSSTRLGTRFPLKPVLVVSLFATTFSFAEVTLEGRALSFPSRLIWIVPAIVIVGLVAARMRGFSIRTVTIVLLAFMVASAGTTLFHAALAPDYLAAVVGVGTFASNAFTTLLLGQISFRMRVNALWLFSIARSFDYLGLVFGSLALTPILDGTSGWVVPIVFLLVMGTAFAMTFDGKTFFDWGPGLAAAGESQGDARRAREASRVAELREYYALTSREEEVLLLLMRGGTVASLAEELFIAPGTVKAHVQHIYQKLDVHSRSELAKLVGGTETQAAST